MNDSPETDRRLDHLKLVPRRPSMRPSVRPHGSGNNHTRTLRCISTLTTGASRGQPFEIDKC